MRTISDEDIKAICDELEKRLLRRGLVVSEKIQEEQEPKDPSEMRRRVQEDVAQIRLKQEGIRKTLMSFFDFPKTAALLGTTTKEMHKQKKVGVAWPVPAHRMHDRYFFKKSDVEAYLKRKK